jgi:protein-disulfide isomerase
MKLDRRTLIAGAALIAAAASVYWYVQNQPAMTLAPGANAQDNPPDDVDVTELMKAPSLGERALGVADAKVTIVEYASATCPHCASFHKETFPTLRKDYIDTGKVRFVFREFPFDDLALAAFMIARCAPEDKYFPMIEVLFEQQGTWTDRVKNSREELFKIALLAGFTSESFDTCLKNEPVATGILEIQKRGETDFAVKATPTFFVNGKRLRGQQDIEEFKKVIEEALAG